MAKARTTETSAIDQAEKKVGTWASFVKLVRELFEIGLNATGLLAFLGITVRGGAEPKAGAGPTPEEGVTTKGTEAARKLYLNLEAKFGPWDATADKELSYQEQRRYDAFLNKLSKAEASLWADAMAEAKEDAHIKAGGGRSTEDKKKHPTNTPARFIMKAIAQCITGGGSVEGQHKRIDELVAWIRQQRLTANLEDRLKEGEEAFKEGAKKLDTLAHLLLASWATDAKTVRDVIAKHPELAEIKRQIEETDDRAERMQLNEEYQRKLYDITIAYRQAHPKPTGWSVSDKIVFIGVPAGVLLFLLSLAGLGKVILALGGLSLIVIAVVAYRNSNRR